MKFKHIIIIIITIIMSLLTGIYIDNRDIPIGEVVQTVNYTANTKTVCVDDVCTVSIYSDVKFVQEDGQWKNVENAKSLKQKGFSCDIIRETENDPYVDCVDFNFTNIYLENISSSNNRVPFKIYFVNQSTPVEEKTLIYSDTINLNSVTNRNWNVPENTNIMDYEIHLGENSTIITIDGTDVLHDTYLYEGSPDSSSGGTYNSIYAGDNAGNRYVAYIKYNISIIDAGYEILDSKSCGLVSADIFEEGDGNISIYGSEVTWNESMTWNTQVDVLSSELDYITPDGTSSIWTCFNVTSWVSDQYVAGAPNISFRMNGTGSGEDVDYWGIYSRDYAGVSKPYLNITYQLNTGYSTFGYDTIGGSSISGHDVIQGSVFTAPENGTGTGIAFYCQAGYSSGLWKAAVYNTSGSLLGYSDESEFCNGAGEWKTLNFDNQNKPTYVAGEDYVLVSWADQNSPSQPNVYYDTGGTGKTVSQTYDGSDFPSSVTFSNVNRNYSIYAKYEATSEGGGETISLDVGLSTGVDYIRYRVASLTSQDVEPTFQTNSIGIFNITNNGTTTVDVCMWQNDTYTDVETECAPNYFSSGMINLTTTPQLIINDLAVDANNMVWCRRDYDTPASKVKTAIYFNTSTNDCN